MLPQQTLVVRGGQMETVEAETLVVGDIVVLRNGARVPADLRLITCTDLKLETSAMTGIHVPVCACK
jgi:P-type E1-E2 ATPase